MFLFVPSVTPSATDTPVPSDTPTPTESPTFTATSTGTFTPTLTPTDTLTCTPTNTLTPTMTQTPLPTFDETKWFNEIFEEVTQAAESFFLAQTPSPTPSIPDSELYTGLRMINTADGKELYFVKVFSDDGMQGFWIDWNEVSNAEYAACVDSGSCTAPLSQKIGKMDYYSVESYRDHPVVNVTEEQAVVYCSSVGMELLSLQDWIDASDVVSGPKVNADQMYDRPLPNDRENHNLFGNVWELTRDVDDTGKFLITGGSWKTAIQDIRDRRIGNMSSDGYAEDIGFRCIIYVYAEK